MNQDILFFFDGHMDALPIYERLEEMIFSRIPGSKIKVSKTQIGFSGRRVFAVVSFLPVRRAGERKKPYITVTFGHFERVDSPRIDGAVEVYPNRWTHHVMVFSPEEIDEELMGWIKEAAAFSAGKR